MPDALASDEQPFAVWLVPQKDQSAYLSGVIHYLCEEHKADPFEPHCTVVSGITKDVPALITETERVLPKLQPVTLEVQKIACGNTLFKTLYVQFRENHLLLQMFKNLQAAIPENHTDSFSPHASLLYKEIPLEKRVTIAANLEIPLQETHFDSVKIIVPRNNRWHDISSWETVFEKKLTSV